MIVSSLRRPADQFQTTLIPQPISFQNYVDVFNPSNNFARALLNSIIVASTVTVLTLIIGTFAAYALARLDFPFKNVSLGIIIACSMFPGIAMVIPLFGLFTDIGWINTYQALILPALSFGLPLAVWILTAFFRQMPAELEEAAMIDGCTQGQAFRKVIIPIAAPGVFTTAIIVFVAAWNEYIIALTMTNKAEYRTATVGGHVLHRHHGPRHPVRLDHGGGRDPHRAAADHGADLPAAHRRGPDRGRREELATRAPTDGPPRLPRVAARPRPRASPAETASRRFHDGESSISATASAGFGTRGRLRRPTAPPGSPTRASSDGGAARPCVESTTSPRTAGTAAGEPERLASTVSVVPSSAALVGEHLLVVGQQQPVVPVHHDGHGVPQRDQPPVVVEHRVRVLPRGLGVDLDVVGVDRQPGRAGGEARLRRGVPLHGVRALSRDFTASDVQHLGIVRPRGDRPLRPVHRLDVAVVGRAR